MNDDLGYTIADGVTQSLLASWMTCRRQAYLMLRGLRRVAPRDSLLYGSLWHYVLEYVYTDVREGRIRRWDAAVAAWARYAQQWQAAYWADIDATYDSTQAVEILLAQAEAVWPSYCRTWWQDFDQRRAGWQELESVFDVPFHGIRLRGKRDGLRQIRGGAWLLETKTKSQISEDILTQTLSYNFQNLYYLLATVEETGHPVAGVLYNVIRRPGLRLGDGESLVSYRERIAADAQKRPDHYFKRMEITYSADRVERFRADLLTILHEFRRWIEGKSPTYANTTACEGRVNCPYIAYCATDNDTGYTWDGTLFEELETGGA
jgi:hypothetical protein